MKPLLILILSLSFSFAAFGQALRDSTSNKTIGLNGKWRLVLFKNLKTGKIDDTASIQNRTYAYYKRVRLNFKDSANVGKIQGKSFCNDVSGSYKIYEGSRMIITSFGGAMVDCLNEDKFWKGLHSASSYKVNNDSLLILYNNDSEEMLFTRDK